MLPFVSLRKASERISLHLCCILLYFRKQYWSWLWPLLSKGFISQNIHKYKAISSRISLGTFTINSHTPLSQPMTFTAPCSHWLPCTLGKTATWNSCHIQANGRQGDQVMDAYKLLAGHTANLRDRGLILLHAYWKRCFHKITVFKFFGLLTAARHVTSGRTRAEKISILT